MGEFARAVWEGLDRLLDRIVTIGQPKIAEAVKGDRRRAVKELEKGRRYYNKRELKKARDYFERAVISDESYSLAHYYLGLVLYRLEFPQAGIAAWRRATEVDPDSEAAQKATRKLTFVGMKKESELHSLKEELGK